MMKHFYPYGSGLFQDENGPIYRTQVSTEWSDEYENDVELYGLAFAITKSQTSLTPIIKTSNEEISFGRMTFIL